ncbi:MAG: GNAT family N-acetyltransferase [Pararhodobacter sp.]|nr:GNAT family N-acetyltransferase [Pararhodobacter sp.]
MPPAALHAALEASWPAAARHRCGPFTLREGAGGGKRVSAATLDNGSAVDGAAIAHAEAMMRGLGQPPLFMIRAAGAAPGDVGLDAALAARGYEMVDPTLFFAAPVQAIARAPGPMSLFGLWPPLAVQCQLWQEAGIGPARQAVMARTCTPRRAFIARHSNRAAGVAFCAIDTETGIAMLHALEVEPGFRRKGVARDMVQGIAQWAEGAGAAHFGLAVTERNIAARALYAGLGMAEAGRYHYRQLLDPPQESP